MPPREYIPQILESANRIDSNPFATPATIDIANDFKLMLERRKTRKSRKRKVPDPQPGYVYLLKGGGFYKIGCSKNVDKRTVALATKLPFVVEELCRITTADRFGTEHRLHEQFADKRVNGEWFELDEADVEYIRGLAG